MRPVRENVISYLDGLFDRYTVIEQYGQIDFYFPNRVNGLFTIACSLDRVMPAGVESNFYILPWWKNRITKRKWITKFNTGNRTKKNLKYFLSLFLSITCQANIGTDTTTGAWLNYNSSYLNDTKTVAPAAITRQDLISDRKVDELTQQYDDLTRTYFLKQQFGLVDMKTESDYDNQMSNFSHAVWQALQQKQSQEQFQKVRSVINNNEVLSALSKPVTAAGALVAVYHGQPIDVKISDNSKLTAMTNFTNQTAYLKVHSCDFDSDFEFNNNPNLASNMNPYSTVEQYKFSLSKNIVFDINGGTTYGFTSTYLTSFVRRGIIKHVTCEVDYVNPVSPEAFSLRPPEAVLKLNYGLNF